MNAYLERVRAWWNGLADSERRAVALGGAVLALVLLYVAAWQPLTKARHKREVALADARTVATQLELLAGEAQRRRGTGATLGAGQSLLAVVDQSRRASGITKAPSRLEPEGDTTVRIWLEDVPFDVLVRWLSELQLRYGVRVDNADLERESGPGLVNARLTLMRG